MATRTTLLLIAAGATLAQQPAPPDIPPPPCTDTINPASAPKTAAPGAFPLDDGRWINSTGAIIPGQPAKRQASGPNCSPYPEKDPATGKFGFRMSNGEWLTPLRFAAASEFRDGRAAVVLEDPSSRPKTTISSCSYLRLDGRLLEKRFQTCTDFRSGAAFVMGLDDVSAIINRDGDPLVENTQAADWGHTTASMADGLVALLDQTSGKVGYANAQGSWVIQPRFAQGFDFSAGLAAATLTENGKVGFIDASGKVAIPFQFGAVNGEPPVFSEGLALVAKDTTVARTNRDRPPQLGFIDNRGRWIIAPRFSSGGSFSGRLAHVYAGNQEQYIDRTGRVVWPPARKVR